MWLWAGDTSITPDNRIVFPTGPAGPDFVSPWPHYPPVGFTFCKTGGFGARFQWFAQNFGPNYVEDVPDFDGVIGSFDHRVWDQTYYATYFGSPVGVSGVVTGIMIINSPDSTEICRVAITFPFSQTLVVDRRTEHSTVVGDYYAYFVTDLGVHAPGTYSATVSGANDDSVAAQIAYRPVSSLTHYNYTDAMVSDPPNFFGGNSTWLSAPVPGVSLGTITGTVQLFTPPVQVAVPNGSTVVFTGHIQLTIDTPAIVSYHNSGAVTPGGGYVGDATIDQDAPPSGDPEGHHITYYPVHSAPPAFGTMVPPVSDDGMVTGVGVIGEYRGSDIVHFFWHLISPTGVVSQYEGNPLNTDVDEDGEFEVFLTIQDAAGAMSVNRWLITVDPAGNVSILVHPAGPTMTAHRNSSREIEIANYDTGTASRQILTTFPDEHSPSLWERDGRLMLATRNDTTSLLRYSDDGGTNWSDMATPFTGPIKHQQLFPTAEGGAVGVFVVSEGGGAFKIVSKYTPEPANWPDDTDAVLVTTATTAKAWTVTQPSAAGFTEFRATNGVVIYISRDYGATWALLP